MSKICHKIGGPIPVLVLLVVVVVDIVFKSHFVAEETDIQAVPRAYLTSDLEPLVSS